MTYQEALSYLNELNTFGIKLGLQRITRLLELLENPQKRYKTIHVTGTNGKGSVSVMLAAVLNSAGINTGMYTSPHLSSYTERIQIDGKKISKEDFAAGMQVISDKVTQLLSEGEENPTQFEVLTALAFYLFAQAGVEYVVVEVGLGGLLDSTNVIIPEVSVITNVTMEHADRCGGTLEGIANHKAGIIKDGVPVITAATGDALEIIRQRAMEKSADLFVLGEDFDCEFKSFDGIVQQIAFSADLMGVSMLCALRLLGDHQVKNSAVAIMTALLLANSEPRITSEKMHNALLTVSWPGRFELMELREHQMVIDGAHNPDGTQMLRQNLDRYFPDKKIVFLLGILKDKDIHTMVTNLIRPEDSVVVAEPESERAEKAEILAHEIIAARVQVADSIESGLDKVEALADNDSVICAAGSLYLIGRVRELLTGEV